MAVVKYSIRSKKDFAKISIRFYVDKKHDFKRSLPITINSRYFNNKTGKVRNIAEFNDKVNVQNKLNELENYVLKNYNEFRINGLSIDKEWFKQLIDSFFTLDKEEKIENTLHYLENYTDSYIKNLDLKSNPKTGEVGVSNSTKKKYETILRKIKDYDEFCRKKHLLSEIDVDYRDNFLKFLLDEQNLSRNTAGRYLVFIKTLCVDARKKGYKVSDNLDDFKGFKMKTDFVTLDDDEIKKIRNVELNDKNLINARNWLFIGCYLGQRAVDLLRITKDNLKEFKGHTYVVLRQDKTRKKVSIPIHPELKSFLEELNWEFPQRFAKNDESSKTLFNRHIKKVCEKAEINSIEKGSKFDKETKRNVSGYFEKHELVSSHICRRSFATRFYGDVETSLLISVTGHGSEKEFLRYIDKNSLAGAEKLADIWSK